MSIGIICEYKIRWIRLIFPELRTCAMRIQDYNEYAKRVTGLTAKAAAVAAAATRRHYSMRFQHEYKFI